MRRSCAACILLLLAVAAALPAGQAQKSRSEDEEDQLADLRATELPDDAAPIDGPGGASFDLISRLREAEEAAERPTGDSGGSDAGVASGAAVAGGGAVVAVPRPGEGAAVADGDATIARTGAAAAAAAKPEPKAPAPPVQKFKVYNEQWLEQAEGIAEDFVSTPAMERLKSGQFGSVDLKDLGIDGAGAVATGVHAVLSRCLHTLNLFKAINMFHEGVLPKREMLPECAHRKFRLLFVLEKGANYFKGREVLSELASVNIRLFPFAAALAKRGHTVLVSDPDHLHQVDMDKLDAIVFVKVLEQGFQMLHNSSVPLIWDHVDEWDGFPFWNLEQWPLKEAFAGVLTAGRVAKVAFDKAGIPAQVLYHNHANYANFHRADRSAPVRVLALQGDYHSRDSDIFPMLEEYSEKNNLTFRSGHYTGRGWEVQEYAQTLQEGIPNYGGQLGWYMADFCRPLMCQWLLQGFRSVDVAVLWPKGYTQFHICYKPTSRLAQFASLGIPLVTYPFASYIDVLVEFGYPLVAETLEEAAAMLDQLVASPQLRQEASEKLLEIARFLSVEELSEQYENALCHFLSPEALELRKSIADEQ